MGAVEQPASKPLSVIPGANGVTLEGRSNTAKLLIAPEYSSQTQLGLNVGGAIRLGENAALGLLLAGGDRKNEVLLNAGFNLDPRQRLIFSFDRLRQNLEFDFVSGADRAWMTQNSGGVSYQYQLGQSLVQQLEFNTYLADTSSRNLAAKTYTVNTTTLFELWNDPRRIAGGRVAGVQGRIGLSPLQGSNVKLSLGGERLVYDLLAGDDKTTRLTGGIEWIQQLGAGYQLMLGADSFAAQSRYSLGLEGRLNEGQQIGLAFTRIQGHDGAPDDNRVLLSWSMGFGETASRAVGMQPTNHQPAGTPMPGQPNDLLDQVARRPAYLPSQVIAKVDKTATPTRLVAIDKTGLPAGSSIAANGDITVPLGVAVTAISGITRNAAAFTNSGQFALSGNSLIVRPSQMIQPATGITDTYAVVINNVGGGTTTVTLTATQGSVHIVGITVTQQPAAVNNEAPTIADPNVTGFVLMTGQNVYRSRTDSDITVSGLAASDPDGLGSYTIVSTLFGTLASGQGTLPVSVNIPTSGLAGRFGQTDTVTISVTDAGTPSRTSTKSITINIDL